MLWLCRSRLGHAVRVGYPLQAEGVVGYRDDAGDGSRGRSGEIMPRENGNERRGRVDGHNLEGYFSCKRRRLGASRGLLICGSSMRHMQSMPVCRDGGEQLLD